MIPDLMSQLLDRCSFPTAGTPVDCAVSGSIWEGVSIRRGVHWEGSVLQLIHARLTNKTVEAVSPTEYS